MPRNFAHAPTLIPHLFKPTPTTASPSTPPSQHTKFGVHRLDVLRARRRGRVRTSAARSPAGRRSPWARSTPRCRRPRLRPGLVAPSAIRAAPHLGSSSSARRHRPLSHRRIAPTAPRRMEAPIGSTTLARRSGSTSKRGVRHLHPSA